MKRPRGTAARLALLAAAAGCAGPAATAPAPAAPALCRTGDTALERDELYFGRNRKRAAEVSEGEWRGADGTIEEEKSKVLAVFHPAAEASRSAVDSIVAAYRAEFAQEAVLRARTPACVGVGTGP